MELKTLPEIDYEFSRISAQLESLILRYVNPLNLKEEKEKFLKNQTYTPKLKYLPKNPVFAYFNFYPNIKKIIEKLNSLKSPEPFFNFLITKKRKELLTKTDLIRFIASRKFTKKSIAYYGKPSKSFVSRAKKFLKKDVSFDEKKVSPSFVLSKLKEFVKEKNLPIRIELSEYLSSRAIINYDSFPTISLNKQSSFFQKDANRLIVHEIETHLYRYLNGQRQQFKFLGLGFGNYILTEEGLAVLNEYKTGNLNPLQLKQYAGRLYAINLSLKHPFQEVFSQLSNYFSPSLSFDLALRAKRGTFNLEEPGAFTKDYIYYEGFLYLKNKVRSLKKLKKLHYAKISLDDLPLLEKHSLLLPGPFLPSYLSS